jgi:hypothetical protein
MNYISLETGTSQNHCLDYPLDQSPIVPPGRVLRFDDMMSLVMPESRKGPSLAMSDFQTRPDSNTFA